MLELLGVTAGYGRHVVLRDVTVIVPDNAVVALVGPNGAGKTTLLKVAAGLLRPMSGQVILNGEDVTGWSPHRRSNAGLSYVPEGRGIFGDLKVRDNVRLQAPASVDLGAVEQAGNLFPVLAEREKQRAGTLSGGEQQMLALAGTVVSRSNVALLDEVSLGLAPQITADIFEYLREVVAEDRSVLLVEQYLQKALELSDYVYVLKKGQLEFVGEAAQVTSETVRSSYLGGLT